MHCVTILEGCLNTIQGLNVSVIKKITLIIWNILIKSATGRKFSANSICNGENFINPINEGTVP